MSMSYVQGAECGRHDKSMRTHRGASTQTATLGCSTAGHSLRIRHNHEGCAPAPSLSCRSRLGSNLRGGIARVRPASTWALRACWHGGDWGSGWGVDAWSWSVSCRNGDYTDRQTDYQPVVLAWSDLSSRPPAGSAGAQAHGENRSERQPAGWGATSGPAWNTIQNSRAGACWL